MSVVDVAWLYNGNRTILAIAKMLMEVDNPVLNDTEFVIALLDIYWQKFRSEIIKY